jgi:hypothetical protein
MNQKKEVLIIGGGLAGLTCAIHLSTLGIKCILIEKNGYPNHKVCGEYVSNEVLPYLNSLGIYPANYGAKSINKFLFSTSKGKTVTSSLPLGGFGISRFALDKILFDKAIENGVEVIQDTVKEVVFNQDEFTVKTGLQNIKSALVVGAFGKRSNLDKFLKRRFVSDKSPWLAVKAHYKADFDENQVALHNFSGGYCGLSKVESDAVNVCYLADYQSFKKYKNIEEYQEKVLCKNPHLEMFFSNATKLFENSLSISQISFAKKTAIENHILMIGDTAGLIHPLCGNGMAMAIHAAKICAESISAFIKSKQSRAALETEYTLEWNGAFKNRLLLGKRLSHLLENETMATLAINSLSHFPSLLPQLIKRTHGKPLNAAI